MSAALVIHAEDELALDSIMVDQCRKFYQAADYQYRQLLGRK
jgi:hypothetical protein